MKLTTVTVINKNNTYPINNCFLNPNFLIVEINDVMIEIIVRSYY